LTRDKLFVRVIIGTGDRDMLIPHGTVAGIIGPTGYNCADQQRLYSIRVGTCDGRPCKESDLVEVNATTGTWAPTDARGWFTKLSPGEKVASTFAVSQQYAYYVTFLPTVGCGAGTTSCTTDFKGEGREYTRHYLSGKPHDDNADGVLSAAETVHELGQGVPSAPRITTGVSASGATVAGLGAGESGTATTSSSESGVKMEASVLVMPVSLETHNALHY
jgi:hypothetical protein